MDKIMIVTSFNESGLKSYAHCFLETYNLPFDLVVYSEEKLDLSNYKIKNLKFEYLFDDLDFKNFINQEPPKEFESRRNNDSCNKFCCKDFCFEHVVLKKTRLCKECGLKPSISAITALCLEHHIVNKHVEETKKFSYKIFSQKNAIKKYKNNYDYLLWIDSDCVFNNVPTNDFGNLVKKTLGDSMLGYLERYNTYTETGFIIINLNHKYIENYYNEIAKIYISHEIYYLIQNHDCWVFDLVRKRFENIYKIKNVDLANGYCKKNKSKRSFNVLSVTSFIKYLFHHKGKNKFKKLEDKQLEDK